jgi:choline dehydrogenase
VIVCGGAYNSPKLLMLSGIGPGEHLRERGVEIVLDRPAVGENLSDHLASEVLWTAPEPEDRSARRRWRSARLMLATQAGAFASTLAEAGAFLRLGPGAPAPDIQLHCAPVYFAEAGQIPEAQGVWVSPCLLTPASRGSVRLAAANPSIDLEIENRFGSAPDDLRRLAAGVRFAMALGGAPALKPFCAEAISAPEDTDQQAVSDHIARTAFAFYHPVGTCRMGSDAHAVVDEQLRVRGVADLRVIDASVMPVVPRGNTNAPTIALAERAADLLRHGRALSAPGSD